MLVGSEDASFTIQERLLRSRSRFLDAALGGDWRENTTKEVRLPEECPSEFRIYASWANTGTLFANENTELSRPEQHRYLELAGLYVMGSRLQDLDFCDAIIDAMFWKTRIMIDGRTWDPGADSISIIYENTLPGDSARRFMVDICIRHKLANRITTDDGEALILFAADVARAALSEDCEDKDEDLRYIIRHGGSTCKYHHHGHRQKCYRAKKKGSA